MSWSVSRFHEPPAISHARPVPEPVERSVWVFEPSAPALVLGSAQRVETEVAADIDVVRRRSGGGAVLVVPGEVLWVDVLVPAGDPLWNDDVGRAFGWLGDVWAAALGSLGVETTVHSGALVRSAWSDQVCFAGVGPGEVLNAAGHKVVGMAQRRTRWVARFQCAALGRWDAPAVVAALGLPAAAAPELEPLASGVELPLEDLLVAFLAALP